MTALAVGLLLVSAAAHAGWNLLTKRSQPSAAFFLVASAVGMVLFLPVLVLQRAELAAFPAAVWVLVAVTGAFLTVYYWSLARAYRGGEMSVAYPIARSSPIIVVTVATLVLGQGDEISTLCVVGIVLVVGGCYLVPMRRFGDLRLRNFLTATAVLALLAACGTAGYSMVDDAALVRLRDTFAGELSTLTVTLMYACLETVSACVWLGVTVAASRSERARLREVGCYGKRAAVLAGVLLAGGYALVLVSMAFVANVSYVVAFRQVSIPLGAALGILVMHERACAPKLTGVAVILVGLVLVALG